MKPIDPPNRFATGDSPGRMGEWGAPCAILISAWVTSWGAQSGDLGWGGGRLGHGGVFLVFFSDVAPFFGRERLGRREKIRSDLKNCNDWRLARETLAIGADYV